MAPYLPLLVVDLVAEYREGGVLSLKREKEGMDHTIPPYRTVRHIDGSATISLSSLSFCKNTIPLHE
jgi:hypothetical protein